MRGHLAQKKKKKKIKKFKRWFLWFCVGVSVRGVATRLMIRHPRRKRRIEKSVGGETCLTKREQVLEQLRDVQWISNCSTKTLQCILDRLNGKLGELIRECDELPTKVSSADAKMQKMVCSTCMQLFYVGFIVISLFIFTFCTHLGGTNE